MLLNVQKTQFSIDETLSGAEKRMKTAMSQNACIQCALKEGYYLAPFVAKPSNVKRLKKT
jgi:hypothetical protein